MLYAMQMKKRDTIGDKIRFRRSRSSTRKIIHRGKRNV